MKAWLKKFTKVNTFMIPEHITLTNDMLGSHKNLNKHHNVVISKLRYRTVECYKESVKRSTIMRINISMPRSIRYLIKLAAAAIVKTNLFNIITCYNYLLANKYCQGLILVKLRMIEGSLAKANSRQEYHFLDNFDAILFYIVLVRTCLT